MNKLLIYLCTAFLLSAFADKASAQMLEVKNEKDARSVSIKMKDGVPSSRIIVTSSFMLTYDSNMGDVTKETVGQGMVNGLFTDTLYFYLQPHDSKRRITISTEGYPSVVVPVTLLPKETYRCFVYDPNKPADEEASNPGSSEYQFQMAQKFDFGKDGFSKDEKEAVNWYTKAAEQGHGLAQVTLGKKYSQGGNDFAKDSVEAAKWYLIAAQQNYDSAQYAVANCFLEGNGMRQDSSKAYYWYSLATDNGIDSARYKMADMLLNGFKEVSDVETILPWFRFFADENQADAQYVYGQLILKRLYSPQNAKVAIEYLKRSAAQNHVEAMLYIGEKYFDKNFAERDVTQGMEYLRLAKEAGHTDADSVITLMANTASAIEKFTYTEYFAKKDNPLDMANLGTMYYYGTGTAQDYEKAFDWFSKASEQKNGSGLNGLGLCYYYGHGAAKDLTKALTLLKEAVETDKYNAGLSLGDYYNQNDSLKNIEKAKEYYTLSANEGNAIAQNKLGVLIFESGYQKVQTHDVNGKLTTVTFQPSSVVQKEALGWLQKSAEQGYEKGQFNYAYCLIALIPNSALHGSDKGKEAVKLFRTLAAQGNKKAMIATSNLYKYNIGVNINEAHQWRTKAAASGDYFYKALLGCFENDESAAIAQAINKLPEAVRLNGVSLMIEAANNGCTFVYPRIEYYYKVSKKDRKEAKAWEKKIEALPAGSIYEADKTEFIK